jgi:hypothetical protein
VRHGEPDDEDQGHGWTPSAKVTEAADRAYREHQPVDLDPLTDWYGRQLREAAADPDPALDLFAGALYDLSLLTEEIRYHIGVGALYLLGLQAEIESAQPTGEFAHMGFPVSALALLAPYVLPTPPPSALLTAPGLDIAGHRVLGGWWAGQVIDSALIRCMSAMDRLAVLLFTATGRVPPPNRAGEVKMPAYRKSWLDEIDAWAAKPEWKELRDLLDHPVFQFIKGYRDGFIHDRRSPSRLNGNHLVAASVGAAGTAGIPADLHLAMARGFLETVLRPATSSVGALLQTSIKSPGEAAER